MTYTFDIFLSYLQACLVLYYMVAKKVFLTFSKPVYLSQNLPTLIVYRSEASYLANGPDVLERSP